MLNVCKITAVLIIPVFMICTCSCKTPAVIATQTIQEADEESNQKKYEEAISGYQKYLRMAPALGLYRNLTMEADVYRKLAHASSALSEYDSSLYYLSLALEIDSIREPNALNLIEDYRRIGLTYGYKGDYINSIRFLKRSLDLNSGMANSIKDTKRSSAGDTYLSLAQVYYVIGNYREAEGDASRAFSVYRKIEGEYRGLMESYLLLGKIRIEEGNINDGLKLIENSIRIAEENGINTSRHYQALGSACLMESKYEEALNYRMKGLEQAELSGILPQITWMNVKVGEIYSRLGDDENALSYYEKALSDTTGKREGILTFSSSLQMRTGDLQQASEIFLNTGSMTGAAIANLRLGETFEKNQNPAQAEYYFSNADSIFSIMGSRAGQAHAKLGLSRVLINKGDYRRATALINQVYETSGSPEIAWQLHFEKGRIYEKQKDLSAAFREYVSSIEVIEKIRSGLSIEEFRSAFMTDKMHVYERLIMLLMENSENRLFKDLEHPAVETAFYYSERARSRSFLDLLGNKKISSKNSSDTALLGREFRLRQQMGKVTREIEMSRLGESHPGELENYLESLNAEYAKTLELIRLSNREYNTLISVEPSGLPEIQDLLGEDNAILDYWAGREKTVIWVISGSRIIGKLTEYGSEDLEKQISDCRTMLRSGAEDLLKDLYNKLIVPVEQEIHSNKSLYIIPHRSLHFLPFQALMDTSGTFLIEKFNISYAPSASVLKHCSLKDPALNNDFLGLALGNMSLGNFSSLPGTSAEIRQIIQLYPGGTAKFENETSETYFKTEADAHTVLHLATHGFLDSRRPMNSYLLLPPDDKNDGLLTVSEIFDLNLNSKLVVLSACETGLGMLSTGDEMIGLSRAFMYAGTPAIIVSLWPVEDATTALLMTRLHQYYSAGYRIQEALTYAQRDLLNHNFTPSVERGANHVKWENALKYEIESGNKTKARNPFFWAPFVLIGFGGNSIN